MNRFGSDPLAFFNSVYTADAPWDIGASQPAMAALLAQYPPAGLALDLGCGSGDLSIHLAQLGCRVVGIDFVESAVKTARQRAASLPLDTAQLLEFRVADALKLSQLQQQFETIVDSGFFHLFDPEECDTLVQELALILPPHGRYYMHEFSIEFPVPNVPRKVTAEELQARFTTDKGWRILEIQTVEFLSRVAPPVPAVCACIERLSVRNRADS